MSASLLSPAEFLDLVKTGKMPERLMQRASVDATPDVSGQLQAIEEAAASEPEGLTMAQGEKIQTLAESRVSSDDRKFLSAMTGKVIAAVSQVAESNPLEAPRVIFRALVGVFTAGLACGIEDVVAGKVTAETIEGLRDQDGLGHTDEAIGTAVCIGDVPNWFTQAKVYKLSTPFKGRDYVAISRLMTSALLLGAHSDGRIASPVPLVFSEATDEEILKAQGYSLV